jgi:hypothetical protein
MVQAVHATSSFFKNSEFSEEKEWRIIVLFFRSDIQGSMVKLRIRGERLVPYFPVSIAGAQSRIPLTKIYRGPRNVLQSKRAGSFIEPDLGLLWLLESAGYPPTVGLVEDSAAPFR